MNLLTRLLLYVLTPFLLVSLAVLFVVGNRLESLLREEISTSARNTLRMQTDAVASVMASHRQSLRLLAATRELQSGRLDLILPQLDRWTRQTRNIESFYFNTLDGFAHDATGKSVKVADRPYFAGVLRGEAQITPPLLSRHSGRLIVLLFEPIHAPDGHLVGALAASIDIAHIVSWLDRLRADPRAATLLIDEEGHVLSPFPGEQTSPLTLADPEKAPKTSAFSSALDRDKAQPLAMRVAGQGWQVFHSAMPETGWKLGLIYPDQSIFAIVDQVWLLGAVIIAAIALAAGFAAYFFNRSLLAPIRQLAAAQAELEHGNLAIRVGQSGHDEFSQLSASFDRMAEKLGASALAASRAEARFRLLFENANDAIFLLNGLKFVDLNPATERLFGLSRAQLLQTTPVDLSPPQQADGRSSLAAAQSFVAAALRGTPQYFPWLHRHSDGHPVKTEVTLKRIEVDGKILLQAIVRDVSLRDEAVARAKSLEEKFQHIFQASPDYLIVARLDDGMIVEANEGFQRLSGYSPQEAIGKTVIELDLWADADERQELVQRIRAEGLVRKFEFHFRRRDGVIREVQASVATFDLNNAVHYIAIVHDVSDERAMQRALAASEARLKSILDAAPLSIVINRVSDFSYLAVNPAFEKLLGYPSRSVLGKTPRQVGLLPSGDSALREQTLRLLANGRVDNEPVEMITGEGKKLSCIYSSRLLELDGEQVMVSISTDITRQKQIEEGLRQTKAALKESEARFAALFHSSPIALAVFRGDESNYLFTELNEAWLATFGYPTENVIGQRSIDLNLWQKPEDRDTMHRIIQFTGHLRDFEAWLLCHDGTPILCSISARKINLADRELMLVAYVDITEKRRIEEEIRQLNASLEVRIEQRTDELKRAQTELMRSEKLAALGSLVAGVAHELNTPIGNSLTVATSLADRTAEVQGSMSNGLKRSALEAYLADAAQGTAILGRNLLRASELIQSFKSIAIDQASDQRRSFDLKQIVEEIVHTLMPSLKKKPFQVAMDVPAGLQLDSFPGPLEQVIVNLVNNAILHGFDGRDSGQVLIRAEAMNADRVVLDVQDDGVGISDTNLPRIFDPFFTTKLGKGGSGLGLHIVHNIVCDVLGGHIEARSSSAGTTIRLVIPTKAPEISP